jgi:hypothetical protein
MCFQPREEKAPHLSFFFALGMGYIIALFANLKWPKTLLFPSIACWAAALGLVAWSCYRRQKG